MNKRQHQKLNKKQKQELSAILGKLIDLVRSNKNGQ